MSAMSSMLGTDGFAPRQEGVIALGETGDGGCKGGAARGVVDGAWAGMGGDGLGWWMGGDESDEER